MIDQLKGASVWEQELFAHLTTHEQTERSLLEEYRDAAESSGSNAFQYLSQLIIQDEIRHHRLFAELAETLKIDAEMRPEQRPVPRLDHWGPDAPTVVALARRLLECELADAKELRRLSGLLKDVKDVTLWQLLVRLMELDTQKHVEILEFVARHAHDS